MRQKFVTSLSPVTCCVARWVDVFTPIDFHRHATQNAFSGERAKGGPRIRSANPGPRTHWDPPLLKRLEKCIKNCRACVSVPLHGFPSTTVFVRV